MASRSPLPSLVSSGQARKPYRIRVCLLCPGQFAGGGGGSGGKHTSSIGASAQARIASTTDSKLRTRSPNSEPAEANGKIVLRVTG